MISPDTIRRNVEHVTARIARAAARSGRKTQEICLVAVTKTVDVAEARSLLDAGIADLGENRVQEALRKREALAGANVRWHLIGRLQTNKANKVAGAFALVHSLDSLRLAQALDRAAERAGAVIDALVEVNVSGEAAKAGFDPDALHETLPALTALRHLRITGLMTMAPQSADPDSARPVFAGLRELRDRVRPCYPLIAHLSMGMSQDFEVAIEEGADLVRIGTALFREE